MSNINNTDEYLNELGPEQTMKAIFSKENISRSITIACNESANYPNVFDSTP